MEKEMKPKDYLKDNCPFKGDKGHECVKEGKGRLSLQHVEVIKEAVSKGIQIDGYSVTTAAPVNAPRKSLANARAVVERQKAGTDTLITIPAPRYPEEDYHAYAMVDGKKVKVGMRECCSNCYDLTRSHRSLTYCICENPKVSTVLTRVPEPYPVTIERK
jgi:hypothetical protein